LSRVLDIEDDLFMLGARLDVKSTIAIGGGGKPRISFVTDTHAMPGRHHAGHIRDDHLIR